MGEKKALTITTSVSRVYVSRHTAWLPNIHILYVYPVYRMCTQYTVCVPNILHTTPDMRMDDQERLKGGGVETFSSCPARVLIDV